MTYIWRLSTLCASACLTLCAQPVDPELAGSVPTTPFSLLGPIQRFEIGDPIGGDPQPGGPQDRRPGIIRVNGIDVLLPRNTLVTLPGQVSSTSSILFAPDGTALPRIALDGPAGSRAPIASFQADIQGNIVPLTGSDGTVRSRYVAGLVSITQTPLQITAGFVQAIEYKTVGGNTIAELVVGPRLGEGVATARVRVNDPESRYGPQHSPDPRFAVDGDNTPIFSETGYPMCIPRVQSGDPKCPSANRPQVDGQFLRRFTMTRTGRQQAADAPRCTGNCDSALPAPIQPGDYIEYAGILAKDNPDVASDPVYISAWAILDRIGIFTEPCGVPCNPATAPLAYIALEGSLLGAGGTRWPESDQEAGPGKKLNNEATTRLRFEGFTTDPSRRVEIYGLDMNPASGAETERLLETTATEIVPLGRFRLTRDQANFLPPPRNLRIRLEGAKRLTEAERNQAWAQRKTDGRSLEFEYTAPIGEFIFPENTVFGQDLVPNNFENLCFLFRGIGPGTEALTPFPSSGHGKSQRLSNGVRVCGD